MRIVYCGTPESAVPGLQALASCGKGWEIVTVLTQPDRPAGRGRRARPSPVKKAAVELGLEVWTPDRPKQVRPALESLRPDLVAVVAYGHIFRKWLLELPPLGCVNVHFSLLPRHRGVAPVAWAILAGDTATGVTTMCMDRGVDTGPVYLTEETPIGEEETAGALTERLAGIGASLLVRTVEGLGAGTIVPRPQDETRATYAPRLEKGDGHVDWTLPAPEIARRVRGLSPWPGAFTTYRAKVLKIHGARARPGELSPGKLRVRDGRVEVGTGEGALELVRVQVQGKSVMGAEEWLRGARPRDDEVLGESG